jgi:urease accessory protein
MVRIEFSDLASFVSRRFPDESSQSNSTAEQQPTMLSSSAPSMDAGLPNELASAMGAHPAPGRATLAFQRSGTRTVLATAFATSPLRLLTPKNHGNALWVFLASFGGGLVDGDRIDVHVDAARDTSAFLSTQASTKIYRSPRGCSQHFVARIADGAALAVVPDPVVCFAGAKYAQSVHIDLAPHASLVLLDGYTCGRAARGERWEFREYASRTTVSRGGQPLLVDATRLDHAHGPIADRMGRFEAILSLFAVGPRFACVREAILAHAPHSPGDAAIAASSPLGADGAILRVAAHRSESASRMFRSSFIALAQMLGDDPFARKW